MLALASAWRVVAMLMLMVVVVVVVLVRYGWVYVWRGIARGS
jgi:hypothetical protein